MDDSGSSTFVVQNYVDTRPPESAVRASQAALGSRAEVEAELDAMLAMVREFWQQEPDMVMRQIAGLSARCTELWVHLHRIEGRDRTYKQIRTLQCTPLLEELDRQFRIASRQVEIRRQDIDTARGF